MWTEEERKLAGQLMDSKEMMALLKKLYCPERSKIRQELESVMALDNDVYGANMKALVVAEAHFANQHANIARIAKREKEDGSPLNTAAPR